MIDCENEIFRALAERVHETYPDIYITGAYVRAPSSFPCVSIEEKNNAVWRNGRDSTILENFAAVMYEVNIYSNKSNGRKTECKAIAACVDEAMAHLGFTRTMLNPLPNAADATVYRMTGRYQAIIGKMKDGSFVVYKR